MTEGAMTKLEEIGETFRMVDGSTRLELLLEYADRMPPLPEVYRPLRDAGLNMVHECQAPVFLMVSVRDGRVVLHADVPPEVPTARGFTTLLMEAFDGEPPATVLQAPPDVLHFLGLSQLLGMQRTRGLTGIYYRIRNEVARQLQDQP